MMLPHLFVQPEQKTLVILMRIGSLYNIHGPSDRKSRSLSHDIMTWDSIKIEKNSLAFHKDAQHKSIIFQTINEKIKLTEKVSLFHACTTF